MALRVAGAQLNLVVGDIDGNERRILETMEWAEAESEIRRLAASIEVFAAWIGGSAEVR